MVGNRSGTGVPEKMILVGKVLMVGSLYIDFLLNRFAR
jgi:hypothetical protein